MACAATGHTLQNLSAEAMPAGTEASVPAGLEGAGRVVRRGQRCLLWVPQPCSPPALLGAGTTEISSSLTYRHVDATGSGDRHGVSTV